jgi:anti-sigma B factor antagonist
MRIEFKARKHDEITILEARGRLTLGEGTSELRRAIRELMAEGSIRILLNMAGVSHLDSSGLGELVASYTALRNAGGDLKLVSPGRRIHDLLNVTKLFTIFAAFENEPAALASFRQEDRVEVHA